MNKLPFFFKSKDEGKLDSGYESIQDFFISWTLRCSEDEYSHIDQKVQLYSKKILFQLLYEDSNKSYNVINVKTWRQVNQIGLLAEIIIKEGSIQKKYVLNIENKWYTGISKTQLVKYNLFLENKYRNTDFEIKNIVLYCDSEKVKENEEIAKANNYRITTVEHLKEVIGDTPTNNYLFDEYWFQFY